MLGIYWVCPNLVLSSLLLAVKLLKCHAVTPAGLGRSQLLGGLNRERSILPRQCVYGSRPVRAPP